MKNTEGKLLETSETGPGTGLVIKLNIESMCYTTHTFGSKIIIHHPDEIPNAEDEGFLISPGQENLISLKRL
ncbi:hypothetical protein CEXT_704721 [Caerostris extrusa]|uniref:Uncharacterized protein n=1 Tax=Caerostris extrusa TaxID=172846 RepID=A0AAV4MXR7_CAEEX|nr:hypothetical protein CEXT_704721 [Caerostris extrusa]